MVDVERRIDRSQRVDELGVDDARCVRRPKGINTGSDELDQSARWTDHSPRPDYPGSSP